MTPAKPLIGILFTGVTLLCALAAGCSGGESQDPAETDMATSDEGALPTFRYHPDPVATGVVVESDVTCVVCEKQRGYVYIGAVYSEEEYEECICPWCIHDGSAAETLKAEFFDSSGVGGGGTWDAVSADVVKTIVYRTPSFMGWQQEQWWTHCDDAAAFLGRAGREEIEAHGPGAIAAIRASTGLEGDDWERFLDALDPDDSPTAYLFRCLHCGEIGGYQDSH